MSSDWKWLPLSVGSDADRWILGSDRDSDSSDTRIWRNSGRSSRANLIDDSRRRRSALGVSDRMWFRSGRRKPRPTMNRICTTTRKKTAFTTRPMCIERPLRYLVLIANVRVWQLAAKQFVQDDTEGVHVRLEAVGVFVFHSDHFGRHPQYRTCHPTKYSEVKQWKTRATQRRTLQKWSVFDKKEITNNPEKLLNKSITKLSTGWSKRF